MIVDSDISSAWARAFLKVFEVGEISPLVVVIEGLDGSAPTEMPEIRSALDREMAEQLGGLSCETVANTIFPTSLWNPEMDRNELYERYRKIYGRVKKHPRNRYDVYFQRLVAFGGDANLDGGYNQLEYMIETWKGGNHRRSALQASLMDPSKDHTNQRQRGFPCLQQIALAPMKNGGLSITGFYATQYIFERAYGNYLGLFHLGRFMAREMGLNLTKIVCIATPAKRDGTKKALGGLYQQVKEALVNMAAEPTEGA